MKFEITTRRVFAAAHQLRLYDGSLEPLHGHNWVVRVTVGAEKLDAIGVVMDFHELDRQVEGILAGWHNRHLNEVEEFLSLNPSTEHVAVVVAGRLKLPGGVMVVSVEVWETEGNSAVYRS
ncbi:MAG TPA: 6-carboxytetrahydropterin synthase [Tepidisphaeraceae bacterium]|jgi:6-pyruvoyltetrahydropterin/6-carboxytetrahydropterin synthase|nr:6-carboxytetrahydropterin synthase [Tepidisphaeraceae bacterium]